MKVTFISIVIGAFSALTEGLLKRRKDLEKKDDWRRSKLLHF